MLTQRNHYVPQWYQRRFLSAGHFKFYYLDLQPEIIKTATKTYTRTELLHWGPKKCFYSPNLYTLKLGLYASDVIEKRFFGPIDDRGERAVEFIADYKLNDQSGDAFRNLMIYMDAQRLRTPRGLDWLKLGLKVRDQNTLLVALRSVFQMHSTMWTEAEWEIVGAHNTKTKFLLTDNPVTFYNSAVFPLSPNYPYPLDAGLAQIGTRTIFPLGLEHCLIITHVQFARSPDSNPLRSRVNARSFEPAMFDLRKIQTDRLLEEDEVLRINYILKRKATRYIAAIDRDWLTPEKYLKRSHWRKLDHDWFLLPNLYKVSFSGGIVVGYKDGSSFASDEYGRTPRQRDYQDRQQQSKEWIDAQRAKKTWADKRRGKSIARDHGEFNEARDRMLKRDQNK